MIASKKIAEELSVPILKTLGFRPLFTLKASGTLQESIEYLSSKHIMSAPVVEVDDADADKDKKDKGPKNKGFLEVSDLLNALLAKKTCTAGELATELKDTGKLTLISEASVADGLEYFSSAKEHRLALVDATGVKAVYSETDVLRYVYKKSRSHPTFEACAKRPLADIPASKTAVVTFPDTITVTAALQQLAAATGSPQNGAVTDAKGNITRIFGTTDLRGAKDANVLEMPLAKYIAESKTKELRARSITLDALKPTTVLQIMAKMIGNSTHRVFLLKDEKTVDRVVSMGDIIRFFCKQEDIKAAPKKKYLMAPDGIFVCKIIGCSGLAKGDLFSSDPYVKVTFPEELKKEPFFTPFIASTLNPVFTKHNSFKCTMSKELLETPHTIKFEVWDMDKEMYQKADGKGIDADKCAEKHDLLGTIEVGPRWVLSGFGTHSVVHTQFRDALSLHSPGLARGTLELDMIYDSTVQK